jgi:hypothetical protein
MRQLIATWIGVVLLAGCGKSGETTALRDFLKPVETQYCYPFAIEDVSVGKIDDEQDGKRILHFTVKGRSTATWYAEVDPDQWFDESHEETRTFRDSVRLLDYLPPETAADLKTDIAPAAARSNARLFRLILKQGDECQFEGAVVARDNGGKLEVSRAMLDQVSPQGTAASSAYWENGAWSSRPTNTNFELRPSPEVNPNPRTYTSAVGARKFDLNPELDLTKGRVAQLPAGAVVVDVHDAKLVERLEQESQKRSLFRDRVRKELEKVAIRDRNEGGEFWKAFTTVKTWRFRMPAANGPEYVLTLEGDDINGIGMRLKKAGDDGNERYLHGQLSGMSPYESLRTGEPVQESTVKICNTQLGFHKKGAELDLLKEQDSEFVMYYVTRDRKTGRFRIKFDQEVAEMTPQ